MTTTDPINDVFEQLFQSTAQASFNMNPWNWQKQVGGQILRLRSEKADVRHLCVRPTGGGKTLLFHTLAAYMKGVTLCLIPLLSLGADQVNKAMIKTRDDPMNAISAFHLDELKDPDVKELLLLLSQVDAGTTTILYSSPQFLVERCPSFFQDLLNLGVLRFVSVDEIHLFSHFGRSFRDEFNKLKVDLFDKLPKKVPCLFLTATCTRRIKESFESLIGLPITHIHWPQAHEMADRKVSLFINYSSRPFSNMSKSITRFLKINDDLPDKFIVYSNVRSRIKDVQSGMCDVFDKDDQLFLDDIMCIHGQLSKEEKASYTQLFLNPEHEDDKRIKVLCATSGVGNVGINSPDIRAVFRLEFPPSIMDFSQEKGRAGRRVIPDPSNFSYNVFFSIESLVYIFERTMNPKECYIDDKFRAEVVQDAFEVAKMFVSQKKCFYITLENYLGNPYNEIIPEVDNRNVCGMCPYCRRERLFPQVKKAGVQKVLFDVYNPIAINGITPDRLPMTLKTLVSLIRLFPNSTTLLTGSKAAATPSPDIIKKILFLMLSSEIMTLEFHLELKCAVFALSRCKDDNNSFALQNDEYWSNIVLK